MAFVCDALAGGWLRHSDDPGVIRAQRSQHDNDLHSRVEKRGSGRPEPSRPVMSCEPDPIMRNGIGGTNELANTSRIGVNCHNAIC